MAPARRPPPAAHTASSALSRAGSGTAPRQSRPPDGFVPLRAVEPLIGQQTRSAARGHPPGPPAAALLTPRLGPGGRLRRPPHFAFHSHTLVSLMPRRRQTSAFRRPALLLTEPRLPHPPSPATGPQLQVRQGAQVSPGEAARSTLPDDRSDHRPRRRRRWSALHLRRHHQSHWKLHHYRGRHLCRPGRPSCGGARGLSVSLARTFRVPPRPIGSSRVRSDTALRTPRSSNRLAQSSVRPPSPSCRRLSSHRARADRPGHLRRQRALHRRRVHLPQLRDLLLGMDSPPGSADIADRAARRGQAIGGGVRRAFGLRGA